MKAALLDDRRQLVILLPDVKKLPKDPAWQKIESRMVAHNNKKVSSFEE
jgi:hypothetical protein